MGTVVTEPVVTQPELFHRRLYGMMAEFVSPDELLHATERAYAEGYRRMDAYTPTPIHGLAEALGVHSTKVPLVVLIGGLTGAVTGYTLQVFMAQWSYAHNTGGKPLYSWPSWIPITFELTVLFASFAAVFGMLLMNGLPRPYHPVFNHAQFAARASDDRFFLCIEATDPKFDVDRTRDFLRNLNPMEVADVEE